jgi:CRP-like cAMP-binding protein
MPQHKPEKEQLRSFLESSGHISQKSSEEVAKAFKGLIIEKNHYFLQAGKIADEYLFLEKGFMRSYAFDPEGNEVTTGFYSSGQVVFEVASFFTRTPSQENIQALADCEGWVITFAQLNQLFHAMPEFREFGRNLLVRGYASLKTRMLSVISETAEERYEKLLRQSPEIFQNAPLKYIASYLGVTDTSLSRIRKEFVKNK